MVGIANANNVMFDGILGLQFRFDVRCEYNKLLLLSMHSVVYNFNVCSIQTFR